MGIIITFFSIFVTAILGLIVLLKAPNTTYARSFAGMCISIIIWVITNQATNDTSASLMAINLTNKLAFMAGFSALFFSLLFTYSFPVKRLISLNERLVVSMLGIAGFAVSLLEPVVGLAVYRGGRVEFASGEWIAVYVVLFLITLGLICHNLLSGSKHHSPIQRTQAHLILVAFLVGAGVGLTLNVIIPSLIQSWHVTEYGPLSIVLLVGLISYTIIKHRLFDIRLAAVRTAAYVASLATLALLYVVAAYTLTHAFLQDEELSQAASIGLALLLALVFQPVTGFFNQVTDRIFYKDNYRPDEFYTRLNRVLTSTSQLRELLQRASTEISQTLKAEHASFFVYEDDGHLLSVGSKGAIRPTVADVRMLDAHADANGVNRVMAADDFSPRHPLRRMLIGYRIALAMPLMRGKKIVGYLFLGEKRSGLFARQDIRVLDTIADELVIAIQNAVSVEQVRTLNANLQQRIDAATEELRASNDQLRSLDIAKDEFVSMASHQLRTPLTSVKGYISMVLEGDGGKVTKVQKQLLSEAFRSSERMVHLINDFLNVSRVQTGKFMIDRHDIDLAKVVKQEVSALKTSAESRNLKLKVKVPDHPVSMSLDEGKIRQVLMNFIDNALYYSKPKTTIEVVLTELAKDIKIEVHDQGIGVPAKQQAQLFTKFFRADNARTQRPDGTGVGLYLAKKVIDGHGGKLIFSSKEGQGSTFGFSLPLSLPNKTNNTDNA